ncbi:MAG: hypothetical protein E7001_01555 [Coriobacteriaceae bacterium]|nr:hypothetical protein [Coriobacteriaceae bacterium]
MSGFEDRAQATVEMAVVAPVMIVVALIVYNLMLFLAATARFDRMAPDIVIAHGVSPVGGEAASAAAAAASVEDELRRAMGPYPVEVEVALEDGSGQDDGPLLSLVGSLRTYTCTMRYAPWPQGLEIAGASLGAPAQLSHIRAVTVDPWRPGVVV